MSFFINFTRGGQVQFHGIYRFWQVFVRFFKIGFFVFILSTAFIWYSKTKPYELYLLAQWGYATLLNGPWAHPPKAIQFRYPNGRVYQLIPKQILSLPILKKQKRLAQSRLYASLKLAVSISITLSIIAAYLFSRYGELKNQQQPLRGATFATPNEFKRIIKRAKKASQWTLGDVPLPLEAETQHILLCGSPGGGKSVCTHELLTQVRKAGPKALVYDIKGAFIPHYYRPGKDIILNPLDERSPSWNLWQECSSLTDYDAIAAAIVPDSSIGDTFWLKAARTLLSISASQFKNKIDPRMKDLIHHLFCSDLKEVESLLEGTLGHAMVGKDLEKGTRSVILTLVTYCKSLLYLRDEQSIPGFCIRDWVKNEADDAWLFISSNQRMADALKPIISLWLELAVNSLLSLEEDRNRRLWFFFDELASLQRLPSLEPILSRGRGYGACFVGAIQDIHQLKDLYGDKAAEVLVSLFGTSLFFSTNNNHSAKWAAEQLGRSEFLEAREGISLGSQMRDGVTLNHQRRQELLVMDSEIRHLKKREAFMVTAGGWPVTKLIFQIKKQSAYYPALIERDTNEISHQLLALDKKIEDIKLTPNNSAPNIFHADEDIIQLF